MRCSELTCRFDRGPGRWCHLGADWRGSAGWLVDVISIVSGSRNVQIRWFWPINSLSLLRPTLVVSGNAIKCGCTGACSSSGASVKADSPIPPQKSSGPWSLDLRKFGLRGWIKKGLSYSGLSLYCRAIKIEELETAGPLWGGAPAFCLFSPEWKLYQSCCVWRLSRGFLEVSWTKFSPDLLCFLLLDY